MLPLLIARPAPALPGPGSMPHPRPTEQHLDASKAECAGAGIRRLTRRANDRMSEQPELSSIPANPATRPESPGGPQPDPQAPQRIPRWLERAELFLRVLLRLYIGLAVFGAPWFRVFWDDNPLFLRFPTLGAIAVHGAVRGIISGLGVLNLWFAFRDAIRHRNG